jgi:hypothetical protein
MVQQQKTKRDQEDVIQDRSTTTGVELELLRNIGS